MTPDNRDSNRLVSVVIPCRNEANQIRSTVEAVLGQARPGVEVEVIVVDDGSEDSTAAIAADAGAVVVSLEAPDNGNPGRARNRGADQTHGDPIAFVDADCTVTPQWLDFLLQAHDAGATVVGGSLALPAGLPFTARCDYYCGCYLVHPGGSAGTVPHHPPPNLSVRRDPFMRSSRFSETLPLALTNEERRWQAELREAGHSIYFEPRAIAYHTNRPGFENLLRRDFRWGYSAIESKSNTGSARMAWLYRFPALAVAASFPLSLAHTVFIIGCWLRSGKLEPLIMTPMILLSRFAYAAGMTLGGYRWLRRGKDGGSRRSTTRVPW